MCDNKKILLHTKLDDSHLGVTLVTVQKQIFYHIFLIDYSFVYFYFYFYVYCKNCDVTTVPVVIVNIFNVYLINLKKKKK